MALYGVVALAAVRAEIRRRRRRPTVTIFEPTAGAERPLCADCPVQFGARDRIRRRSQVWPGSVSAEPVSSRADLVHWQTRTVPEGKVLW